MTTLPSPKRLGFFTRLLEEARPPSIIGYTQQIVQAERCGFNSAWIAQHHFHEGEGGLPAIRFLAQAAVQTSRIRLGTGIVTLPLELPVRVAEDAAVTDSSSRATASKSASGRVAISRPSPPLASTPTTGTS